MPTILLITEQKRALLLFARMEQERLFRLRVAPTLAQGEEEIAVRLPHFVFAENGISGLSGTAIAAHLRGLLPEESEIILMARDGKESEACREGGGLFVLDLSESDELLQRSVSGLMQRYASEPEAGPGEPGPAPPRLTRQFLMREPAREGPAAKDKRLLWLIPVVLAGISLGVLAYRAREEAPAAAPQRPAAVPPRAGNATAGNGFAPGPATPQKGPRAAGKSPAPATTGRSGQQHRYVVQQGDHLLGILVREYGFSYPEAVRLVPEVKRLNQLSDLGIIQPGETIIIPSQQETGNMAK